MEKQIKIEVEVNKEDIDEALEKANKLLELLKEVQKIVHSLSKPDN